jgi:3'(2'), 5'-bisphosphate nucleotidase
MEPLRAELRVALQAARDAGAVILRHYGAGASEVTAKADGTPVTRADLEANDLLVGAVRAAFPADGVLSEESADDRGRLGHRRVWILDPLDGTRDFVARTGDFAVHVGLAIDGEPVLGVLHQPTTGSTLTGVRGAGATLVTGDAAAPVHGSSAAPPARLRVGVSRTATDPPLLRFVAAAEAAGLAVVRMGASVKFMALAEGRLDAVVCLNDREREWDTCAPEAVLREAGCRITDLRGAPFRYNQPDVRHPRGSLATNGLCHDALLELAAPFAPTTRRILGIDGIDGSGKSTFARLLAQEVRRLGGAPVVLHVDDFRRPVDWSRTDRPEPDLYFDEYYDFALLERCLRDYLGGADRVEVPRFDSAAERLAGTTVLDLRGDLVLIEGVFPLRCAAVREDSLVYLSTTPELAQTRILSRDQRRGRTLENVEHRIRCRYFPGQRRYHELHGPERAARVVIDNNDPTARRLVRRDDAGLPPRVAAALDALVPPRG